MIDCTCDARDYGLEYSHAYYCDVVKVAEEREKNQMGNIYDHRSECECVSNSFTTDAWGDKWCANCDEQVFLPITDTQYLRGVERAEELNEEMDRKYEQDLRTQEYWTGFEDGVAEANNQSYSGPDLFWMGLVTGISAGLVMAVLYFLAIIN